MADLKTLSGEMAKLKCQIDTIMSITKYQDYDDLSGLEDFHQIKNADDRQQLEEYRKILQRLDEVHSTLAYYEHPVREVSRLRRNEQGRYETERGHYYTSGSGIEFLRVEEIYDSENDRWREEGIWTVSTVEHNGKNYYIVGYPKVVLPGLEVRVR